jgi:hypothetical protein
VKSTHCGGFNVTAEVSTSQIYAQALQSLETRIFFM